MGSSRPAVNKQDAVSSLYCWGRGDIYGTGSRDTSPYTTLSRPDNQMMVSSLG